MAGDDSRNRDGAQRPPIPLVRPFLAGNELSYLSDVVKGGRVGADGAFTRDCSRLLEERFGIPKVLLVTSCTSALEDREWLRLPRIPVDCESNFHLFQVLLRDRQTRDGLRAHLMAHGIHPTFHYVPLHSSPMGRKLGRMPRPLPMTDDLSGRLLRLPFYCELTEDDRARVVSGVSTFLTGRD